MHQMSILRKGRLNTTPCYPSHNVLLMNEHRSAFLTLLSSIHDLNSSLNPHPPSLPQQPHRTPCLLPTIIPTHRRPSRHQPLNPQVPPNRLPRPLRRALNPKRRVLIGHHIVLILRVNRSMLRRDEDLFGREQVHAAGGQGRVVRLEHVGVLGVVEVEGGEGGVFGLWLLERVERMGGPRTMVVVG
jgi:hypothetical protein